MSGTVAHLVAGYLAAQGVRRVYGLCGGHIQPLWDAVAEVGIDVVDVRHEAAAVYAAQAEAELTGRLGVVLVTAGPGLANAVTGIANAAASRAPVLVVSGRAPRPQAGMGAMQDIPQAELVRPLCRRATAVGAGRDVAGEVGWAVRAALGESGPPGPAYLDLPADLWDEQAPEPANELPWHAEPRPPPAKAIDAARALVQHSRRPAVVAGRVAHEAADALLAFLDQTGALLLETAESRGAVPVSHPACVPAMRSRVMREADLVVTVGRRLDFQLAYGSDAVFSRDASFLRIGRSEEETAGNRRGDVEVHADAARALAGLVEARATLADPDRQWLDEMRAENVRRTEGLARQLDEAPEGPDGRMHPYRLLGCLNEHIDDAAVVVADGGDILSFARVALRARRLLDCGPLGCLGVGVPFAVVAALNHPERLIAAVIGDGAFGLTGMEVATAVRQRANVVFVVANNEAWNIERQDQLQRYDGRLVGVDLPGCRYDLVARGLGAYAERVERAEDLDAALRRARARTPALLDVLVTRDAVSPDFKNGLAAVPARQALLSWHSAELARDAD